MILNFLGLLLVFTTIYFLIYQQSQGIIPSDTRAHISFIEPYFEGKKYIPHPLWHVLVYHFSDFFNVDLKISASIITSFIFSLYTVIIYKISKFKNSYNNQNINPYLITFISLIIAPFFLIDFNPHIYIGQGSPSVWHNVTLFTVKPFALLSVFFTIKFFQTTKGADFLFAFLFSLISIFAKPSFILIFLPSLVVYMVIKKLFNKPQLFYLSISIISTVSILLYQFIHRFGDNGNSKIIFDYLGVWSTQTPNVFISIILVLGLPILITLFNYKSIKDNEYIKFSWLLIFFSMFLKASFAEQGTKYYSGNFGWSWQIALSIIYIYSIIEYFKQYKIMKPLLRYSLLTILLYQVYVGCYYLTGIFKGITYNATILKFPIF